MSNRNEHPLITLTELKNILYFEIEKAFGIDQETLKSFNRSDELIFAKHCFRYNLWHHSNLGLIGIGFLSAFFPVFNIAAATEFTAIIAANGTIPLIFLINFRKSIYFRCFNFFFAATSGDLQVFPYV